MRQFLIVLGLVDRDGRLDDAGRHDNLRAELIPLLLFGMTISIAYHQESALLFSAALALVVVVSIGQGLYEFIILNAARGHGHSAGRPDSQPLEVDLCRPVRRRRGDADHDRRRHAGRAAVL